MPQPRLLRLERIEVDGLFGVYDHKINLNLQKRVTLLHGPNGVGKTIVLRMVDAILKARFGYFRTIPFDRLLLGFNDGTTLVLVKVGESNEEGGRGQLTLNSGAENFSSEINLGESEAAFIAGRLGFLHQLDADRWIDIRDDELLSSSEVISRYGEPSQAREFHDREEAPWLNEFLQNANAHLIEAQRLVRIERGSEVPYRYGGRRRSPPTISTVVERSRDFRNRLADTMARYGRRSQTLDQSFPQRLISATDSLTEDVLQHKMAALDEMTNGLIELGILDKRQTHPFEVENLKNLDSTQARVMKLYIEDTQTKLNELDDLSIRTRLLLDNVNQKFRYKEIRLDREEGFVATSEMGHIPLSSLSSGEQHELVLHYDLLFNVPTNTIVLIDEPELSLHVAWQKRFLPDLLRIVELTDFDALVATHSPFIVGDNTELMVGLGDSL